MNFLMEKNSQFVIISSAKIDDIISVLHAKCYQCLPLKGYYQGQYEDSCLAWGGVTNDDLKKDVIFLLEMFNQECAIVKFRDELNAIKLYVDASQRPLGTVLYNTDSDNVSYLMNGVSFSFVEMRQYWQPKSIDDFKVGMIVEYINNNKWFAKEVKNPVEEWESLWKLLCKYQKVRVALV